MAGSSTGLLKRNGLSRRKRGLLWTMRFAMGRVPDRGLALTEILPPMSLFAKDNRYGVKRQTVFKKLTAFLERFLGLG